MLVTSPSRPRKTRSIPLVIEGADTPRGRLLRRLLADHPHTTVALELSRNGQAIEGSSFDDADEAALVFTCDRGELSVRRVRAWHAAGLRVIDLGGSAHALEARLGPSDPTLIYGVPELARRSLGDAKLVVAPGPLVTGATLALAPLAQAGFLDGSIEIELAHADPDRLERAASSEEVEFQLRRLNRSGRPLRVFLTPEARAEPGLHLRALLDAPAALEQIATIYETYYRETLDVQLVESPAALQAARLEHQVGLHLRASGPEVEVLCLLDEERRSAPIQALRCMNLMCGLPERLGLAP